MIYGNWRRREDGQRLKHVPLDLCSETFLHRFMEYVAYASIHSIWQQAHGECYSHWLGGKHSFPNGSSGSQLENNCTWWHLQDRCFWNSTISDRLSKAGDGFSTDVRAWVSRQRAVQMKHYPSHPRSRLGFWKGFCTWEMIRDMKNIKPSLHFIYPSNHQLILSFYYYYYYHYC